MKTKQTNVALAALLALGLALTACSQPSSTSVSSPTSGAGTGPATATIAAGAQPTTGAGITSVAPKPTVEGGGEGGVESALVTYSDAAQGFAIAHPGNWTQDSAVTKGVRFVGGDNSMTLEFVLPASKTNAMTYAGSDVAAVAAAFPGFKQLSLAPSTEVKDAIILGYEASGTSAVTGKTFGAHDERYYMPLADGRIAVLTVAGPAANYDREGVRDIALTFKTTK